MADGVDHIDIYADVGEEFNQEAEYGGHDQIDLYDDVISPSANNGDAPEDRDYMDTPPPTNSGMPTSDSRGPPPTDPYGRAPPYDRGDYGPPGREMDTARTPLSEAEFEEIMNRNRAISSSAISRAVSDASAGDYGSAIETLVTAISLIKQSKVSADDRCKVLISSLQDCLHGIESKSYGSGSRRERSRERDHSRSREKSRRHKSRSRDRHDDYYRERSRERERHRDRDRDRDRERDREREYRHR